MDKAITTMLLTIAGVVAVLFAFNALYPAVGRSSSALVMAASTVDQRLKTSPKIIHATGELVNGSWQDTDDDSLFDVFIWVKNVGTTRIVALEKIDVFFGPEGNFTWIPYVDDAGGAFPRWSYTLENDTSWVPTATLRINIEYTSALASGRYYVKVVVANGVSDEHFFSM